MTPIRWVWWCVLMHEDAWTFSHFGVDGVEAATGVHTWWCPRCQMERLARV